MCVKNKLILSLTILFIASCSCSIAQTASVKGVIFDTVNKSTVANASVSLLQKDSALYKLIHSDAKGKFELENLSPGNYLLLVTHPFYENFITHLHLTDTSHIHM